jgi:hypothetical protein
MMIAGILAAVIIVLSQSFHHQAQVKTEKATEKKTEKGGETFISTPADAVTTPTSVIQLNNQLPALDKKFTIEEEKQRKLVLQPAVFVRYFKILFRAFISPNAP